MSRAAPSVSVISDEIAPALDDALAFAAREALTSIDLRMIDGQNVLALNPPAMRHAARRIADAGLTVGCIATPLLKWPGPGQPYAVAGDQFGFDPRERGIEDAYATAFEAAEVFGAHRLRIFTYLTYPGFQISHLAPELDTLLALAASNDCTLVVENEPACNIASIADLALLLASWNHPRLRGVLDIANAWFSQLPPTQYDIAAVAPFVDIVHVKDFNAKTGGFVPLGAGEIPYAELLGPLYDAIAPSLPPLVVETHAKADHAEATRQSLLATRALSLRLAARSARGLHS